MTAVSSGEFARRGKRIDVTDLSRKKVKFLLNNFLHFFFSSRRRHTRYIGDWSSDVCSSDLYFKRTPRSPIAPAIGTKYGTSIASSLRIVSACNSPRRSSRSRKICPSVRPRPLGDRKSVV